MKNWKKVVAALMALVCVFALASCGKSTTTYKFASGGTSGTYYAVANAMAPIIGEAAGMTIRVDSTGASKANIQLINSGEVDFAIVQNDVMDYAYKGTDLFAGEQITSFATIGAVYAEVCQIVAAPDIETVADLKGKTVSIGDSGSGVEFNAIQILAAYGLTKEDITVVNADFGNSSEQYKNGAIDAFFCTAGAPTTNITDLASSAKEFKILNIDDEHVAALKESYPFYSAYPIPAGTYSGIEEDVQTVAVKATIICKADLPEADVYNFTKALFEKRADLETSHAKFKELNLEYATDVGSVPFHAGAQKYYNEVQ
ncbi:MAG: TAXI family TRAP transporter solute-binding subunit [Clostridia bacterium]|nr:TAXI family TRAP transporter solute-binding subunit [Oscillospiraceae bacterium]MBQ7032710.1 TAXI family TRAP transporter solute-binding subunit [Clostridia bacterium]